MNRFSRIVGVIIACCVGHGRALAEPTFQFDIPREPLHEALADLGEVTRILFLYKNEDESLWKQLESPGLRGTYALDAALTAILEKTGVTYEYTAPDTIYLHPPVAMPSTPQGSDDAEAMTVASGMPEILIRGSHSRNADSLRKTDDVRPYTVRTRRQFEPFLADNASALVAQMVPRTPRVYPRAGTTPSTTDSVASTCGVSASTKRWC